MAVFNAYEPLWKALTPEASQKVRIGNYERLFDAARVKVRAWEKANAGKPRPAPSRALRPVPRCRARTACWTGDIAIRSRWRVMGGRYR